MVEINLLPKQYRKTGETSVWQYVTIGVPLLTLLLIGIPELMVGGVISGKQRQLDDLNTQIGILQPQLAEYNKLTLEKSQLSLVDTTVQALTATKTSYWSTDIARFVNTMPAESGAYLNKLFVTDPSALPIPAGSADTPATRSFDIDGVAGSTGSVVTVLNAYEQNNYGVRLKSTQHNINSSEENYTFAATIRQSAPTTVPGTATPGAAGTGVLPDSGNTAPAAPPAAPAPAAPGGKS